MVKIVEEKEEENENLEEENENQEEDNENQEEDNDIAAIETEPLSFSEQVAQQREQYQPTRLETFMSVAKSLIVRAMIFYFIMSFLRRPADPGTANPADQAARIPSTNLFENGTVMDFYFYISEDGNFKDFNNEKSLIWTELGLIYGDWTGGMAKDGIYTFETTVDISENVQNNGSIYLHAYMVKAGKSPDPKAGKGIYSSKYTVHRAKQLNRFKKRKYTRTHNLLTGETTASEIEIKKAELNQEEVMSHWHPNLTINLVVDHTPWVRGSVPPPLDEYIEFLPLDNQYKPVIHMNDYWNLLRDYQPINETTKTLPLSLTIHPITLFKWQLYTAQSMRNRFAPSFLTEGMEESEADQDSIKEAFLETSPYLLGITVAISILHSVFEFLAFKNDIQFWNNRQSLEGLSVRSVFFNVFQSVIVLLFVLDNETNFVVKVSCFIGLGIEIWKINKVVDVKRNREEKLFGILPKFSFTDKGSYVQSSTRQYDQLAFRYLSWALFPLLIAYAVYALLYTEQRGWYSFVLSMIYGFLLTFGFIMMTPQLFINYKLKSVAHLPWRMLSYKFLNTFIDDIFAFVIKMPTMYRIGCFRDDIVFCVYVYQRWIYKTDPSRVNEFGFSADMEKSLKNDQANGVHAIEDSKQEVTKTEVAKKKD